MKINLYYEGGAGDHILAHRFIPKLLKTFPNAIYKVYSDTENNFLQKNVLEYLYPSFYKNPSVSIEVLSSKKFKKCFIQSQFGTEEYRGGIHNVPDIKKTEILQNCDIFYNFHIDSLEFLNYKNPNFNDYFFDIPEPEININNDEKYLVFHLASGSSNAHRLEFWYINNFINFFADKYPNYKIYLISTEETEHFYSEIKKDNVFIFIKDIQAVCNLICSASGFIGVDSAWRLVSHGKNIPTITLSKDCSGYAGVPCSHLLRWLIYPKTTFGLNYSIHEIYDLFNKMLNNNLFNIFPEFYKIPNIDLDRFIVNRKFQLDLEKSC